MARKKADTQGAATGTRYVSDVDLSRRYGTHRATVWRWAANGILPKPVQISPGCTRWVAAEIEAFDAEREAARGTAA
jgi:predicted DNA-binding transcriptional regulator AlpA